MKESEHALLNTITGFHSDGSFISEVGERTIMWRYAGERIEQCELVANERGGYTPGPMTVVPVDPTLYNKRAVALERRREALAKARAELEDEW